MSGWGAPGIGGKRCTGQPRHHIPLAVSLTPAPNENRPKILHCISHVALGGAEQVAWTLVEALRGSFDFEIFAVRGVGDGKYGRDWLSKMRAAGIPVHLGANVPMRFGGVITSGFGMARVVRRTRPSLVHLHAEIAEAGYAAMHFLSPNTRGVAMVRTVHNTVYWAFSRRLARWANRRMERGFVAGVSPGATAAFARVHAESGAAIPPVPPETIYNGVPEPKVVRSESFAAEGPIRLLFGGRFELQKGVDLLPAVLEAVRLPPGRTVQLTLFGSGVFEPRLRELASCPPRGWTVEVNGPALDFRERMPAYDLMLMPSRYEGLGLVAVEALMAGVPVVTTDAEGIGAALPSDYPWRASAGDAGAFATLLTKVLNEPETWGKVAARGRAFARERFSVHTMAERYRALYEQAILGSTGTAKGVGR